MPPQIEYTADFLALTLSDTERSTPNRITEHQPKATLLTLPAEIRLQVLRYVLERRILTAECDLAPLTPNIHAEMAMRHALLRYCSSEVQLKFCWGCLEPHVISTPQTRHTQILSACSMLYEEGRSILYDDHVFCLSTRITDESLAILEGM